MQLDTTAQGPRHRADACLGLLHRVAPHVFTGAVRRYDHAGLPPLHGTQVASGGVATPNRTDAATGGTA